MLRPLLITMLALCSTNAIAQQRLQLPQDSRLWFNVKPVTLDALKGKGVVLYFFEEG